MNEFDTHYFLVIMFNFVKHCLIYSKKSTPHPPYPPYCMYMYIYVICNTILIPLSLFTYGRGGGRGRYPFLKRGYNFHKIYKHCLTTLYNMVKYTTEIKKIGNSYYIPLPSPTRKIFNISGVVDVNVENRKITSENDDAVSKIHSYNNRFMRHPFGSFTNNWAEV